MYSPNLKALNDSESPSIFTSSPTHWHFPVLCERWPTCLVRVTIAPYHDIVCVWQNFSNLGNQRIFSLTIINHNMKPNYIKVFKKPSLGSKRGPATSTSTSTLRLSTESTGTTAPMPSVSACDATASAQVIAGGSVSFQLRPSHLSIDLFLSSRPPKTFESLPLFPPWNSVISPL